MVFWWSFIMLDDSFMMCWRYAWWFVDGWVGYPCFMCLFSPPARWGSLDFNRALVLLLLLLLVLVLLLLAVQIALGTAGLLPGAPDRSGHCRTSTASSNSQWALPDFYRELQIAVGTAGLLPGARDRSGHCWTSTGSSRSQSALSDFYRERDRRYAR